jgi:2-oxoglutarate dehydrogenase E1 component
VKYHLGSSSDREFDGNKVHLSLTANPSHLEIVNPVVLGKARAKQDQFRRDEGDESAYVEKVLPLLLHGDAAFAGQGVVAECFGLSGLRGHRTGGCDPFHHQQPDWLHHQSASFSRSSPYPSDVALMVEAPIFHVNGDDPEAVTYAAKVATEFRQKFGTSRWSSTCSATAATATTRAMSPAFTQPIMYKKIRQAPHDADELYTETPDQRRRDHRKRSTAGSRSLRNSSMTSSRSAKSYKPNKADWLDGKWSGLGLPEEDDRRGGKTAVDRACSKTSLQEADDGAGRLRHPPHPQALFMATSQRRSDDRTALTGRRRALAFGSLLKEGFPMRLSGQDCERGTFSQRHSHVYDQNTKNAISPLNNLGGQARYEVINSMLSEEAVLGFEYGYSLAEPNSLTLWEAQFGDFANGAQVMFDQFISSGERKWLRMSGLVCLLPHGYEGQGPEHSSARLERFLQMCAEDNMQVANCTTPANYFHILRRQMKRDFRKPLIMMTPKSLLRHKRCGQRRSRMGRKAPSTACCGTMRNDRSKDEPIKLVKDNKIRRVVMCSGKVYYDLRSARRARHQRCLPAAGRAALPVPGQGGDHELSRFKQRRDGLVPGRAQEHGRLDVHRAVSGILS